MIYTVRRIALGAILMAVFAITALDTPAQTNAAKQTGTITGSIVAKQDGKPISGASIFLVGTKMGSYSNPKGQFNVKRVPVGKYNVQISSVGYQKVTIKDVEVKADKATKLDVALESDAILTEEVVVEARALRDNDNALLRERQKAVSVSDAIAADRIEQSGGGNAGDAVSKITGASLVDGKYVFIRGLGDRYSNVQLNGASLPSTDPDRKAVQLDIFPSNLLDNIVTVKTFTPDKPGDFTGGSVNLGTKSFPSEFFLKFSGSLSYNSETTFNDILTYQGGDSDWLGFDDGTRDLPKTLQNPEVEVPALGTQTTTTEERALLLDELSHSFNDILGTETSTSPINQSLSISVGTNSDFLGEDTPVGILASLTYKRSFDFYEGGRTARWKLLDSNATELSNELRLVDSKGSNSAAWGGLLTLAYQPGTNHELSLNSMINQKGSSSARYLIGQLPNNLQENQRYETRTLKYSERKVSTFQLSGKHSFPELFESKLEWNSTLTNSSQNEPDLRFLTDDFSINERNGSIDTSYFISENLYSEPARFFRDLEEDLWESKVDIEIPFTQWDDLAASLKIGGLYSTTDRSFSERRFVYRNSSDLASFNGSFVDYVAEDNVGIVRVDTSNSGLLRYRFGAAVQEVSDPRNVYDADQQISAGYFMLDLPLLPNLRFIGGARLESTEISLISSDTSVAKGDLSETDVLPSLNLIYALDDDMNLRFAATQTLARPTFRELAPFASFDFVRGDVLVGNPDSLNRTLVTNLDLRWEWYVNPGELLSVSGFYKDFTDPIERVFLTDNRDIQPRNVDNALVYGVELEARKSLGDLIELLQNFQIGANLTLMESEVKIGPTELVRIRSTQPDAPDTRPLQGQSEFIINVDLFYSDFESGTNIGLAYNIFGERLATVSLDGPDVFEQPRGTLNLTFSQSVGDNLTIKASGSNLLDTEFKQTQEFKGTEYIYQSYNLGVDVSFGVSYTFN